MNRRAQASCVSSKRWGRPTRSGKRRFDASGGARAAEPIDIGSRLELFVDDYLIDGLSGDARLHLNKPQAKEVAIVTDKPWEGNTCAFYTIFQDGDLYRMYERAPHILLGFPTRLLKTNQVEPTFMTSRDGRTFHRWGVVDHAGFGHAAGHLRARDRLAAGSVVGAAVGIREL
ncbi:MAG: hypothetical protein H8E44_30150 [Planctomycetes bacterium]|nr:hypothetical protein [Planctomycetota bacterium]MBL7044497.1 hypothetical protein [Pirellulaceae bacterium]